jgi:activator of 2-hydroxyglutaryl-CoA dehydratase
LSTNFKNLACRGTPAKRKNTTGRESLRMKISSICTVFAESEVISLISKGETRENIAAGIHESVASRVSALVKRIGQTEPVMMTGGVAKNIDAVSVLDKKLYLKIIVTEYAQLAGAIGAAVLARNVY